MSLAESVMGVVILLFWIVVIALIKRGLEQERKAQAAIAHGTVETRRHRIRDRIGLVIAALVLVGVASYAGAYGEGWMALVFGLVCLVFTGWSWRQRRQSDRAQDR